MVWFILILYFKIRNYLFLILNPYIVAYHNTCVTVKTMWQHKKVVFLLFILISCLYSSGFGIVQGLESPNCVVTIHKVEMIDEIENLVEGEADWYYKVTVTDDQGTSEIVFNDPSFYDDDDPIFDNSHVFSVDSLVVTVKIYLYESDSYGDEMADISSVSVRDAFFGYYNLETNALTNDATQRDGIYYRASGIFDGTTMTDDNDANLWFSITDDYEAPVANAGEDRTTSVGYQIDFDASQSFASSVSELQLYQWDFEGDGVFDAEGVQTSFVYSNRGIYSMILKVTDNYGVTDTATCVINVNTPPVASFVYSLTEPTIIDTIEFVDTSTDYDGLLVSRYWNFGDGSVSYSSNPSHQYSQAGTYQVSLTVTDSDGAENTSTISLTVAEVYLPPVANPGLDRAIPSGEQIIFDGSLSCASFGSDIVLYEWDFENDGVFDAEGVQTNFTYSEKGSYTVLLRVTDEYRGTGTGTCIVTVTNALPSSSFTFSPTNPTILDVISFSQTCSDTDGTLVSWYWNFGDGTTSNEPNPSHQYSQKGTYHVSLKTTDNENASKIVTIPVLVVNIAPTAEFSVSTSNLVIGDLVEFYDHSTDPDSAISEHFWDFGDGTTSTAQNPAHQFEGTGDYFVTLAVTDTEGQTGTTSLKVHVSDPSVMQDYLGPLIFAAVAAIMAVILFVLNRKKT